MGEKHHSKNSANVFFCTWWKCLTFYFYLHFILVSRSLFFPFLDIPLFSRPINFLNLVLGCYGVKVWTYLSFFGKYLWVKSRHFNRNPCDYEFRIRANDFPMHIFHQVYLVMWILCFDQHKAAWFDFCVSALYITTLLTIDNGHFLQLIIATLFLTGLNLK